MPRTYVRVTTNQAMSWEFRQLPFWDRVDAQTVKDGSGCHVFTGHKDECGYGRIRGEHGKLVRVHRAVYEREHGFIPRGAVVLHTCDNPACINPAHLMAGTQADNIADMDIKGRRRANKGSAHGHAKLSESDIPEIRARLRRGEACAAIGASYGVSEMTISFIKRGRTWRHVADA